MKYFLHDTQSFSDEKITRLYMEYGYEGIGLFYTILERIAAQEKPIITSVLKKQLFVGKKLEKCWNFMESIGLISSNNGETFNEKLLNFSEKYQIKKEKNAERIAQWRKNQEDKKNVTRSESVRNSPKEKISKVKRSKVKRSKENEIILFESEFSFDRFWNEYGKKTGKVNAMKVWAMMHPTDQMNAINLMNNHKAGKEPRYWKDPERYLKDRRWEDEPVPVERSSPFKTSTQQIQNQLNELTLLDNAINERTQSGGSLEG